MAADSDPSEFGELSPDEAFAALGNETRLQILRTLGAADEPLAFSEIFDRVEYDDSSNFDYHLEQLVGHFVSKTDEGYDLWKAGERVVESVLSGAITEDPVVYPTTIDDSCPFCSAEIQVAYQQERVEFHCPECPGIGSGGYKDSERDRFDDHGTLGHLLLPPAGIQDRTALELMEAAEHWTATQAYALARGVCPRCSARIEFSPQVCEDHTVADERCAQCDLRFAVQFSASCTNCLFDMGAPVAMYLGKHAAVMGFMIEHDIDPTSSEGYSFAVFDAEESVLSTDPLRVRISYSVDNDSLSVTVDEALSVVDVTRRNVTTSHG
jgi:hypothetical protein